MYFSGDGSSPAAYRLDVYTPDGALLTSKTTWINAPCLAVDYWRSVYAPSYSPLTQQGTSTVHVDPALGVSEPALSRLDPTA